MKKNKTIAYMLAAALLVGGTFAGTKALFTDSIKAVGELKISTGDVDIEITDTPTIPYGNEWRLYRNGNELKEGTNIIDPLGKDGFAPGNDSNTVDTAPETPFANNLKPGDILEKIVEVKNIGTLNAKLHLDSTKVSEKLGDLKDFINVEASNSNIEYPKGANGILEPGKIATVKLRLTVNTEQEYAHDKKGINSDEQEDAIVDLTDAWVLRATQTIRE